MMCMRSVCVVAAATLVGVAAQMLVRSQNSAEPPAMQKGISVEMASANHAQAWPQADDVDAWIVTVDNTGKLYFGTHPTTPRELDEWLTKHRRRQNQKLYIKADARATYSSVEKALDAASAAEFAEPVLLVNRPDHAARPGSIVPPEGLDVAVGSVTASGTAATVVELILSGHQEPMVKINSDESAWAALSETLNRHFQKGDDRVVVLKADARLPFAEVVHAIDDCRAAGARVTVETSSI